MLSAKRFLDGLDAHRVGEVIIGNSVIPTRAFASPSKDGLARENGFSAQSDAGT